MQRTGEIRRFEVENLSSPAADRCRYAAKTSRNMSVIEWPTRWDTLRRACELHSATGRWLDGRPNPPKFDIAPPATSDELQQIESALGVALPVSFNDALR